MKTQSIAAIAFDTFEEYNEFIESEEETSDCEKTQEIDKLVYDVTLESVAKNAPATVFEKGLLTASNTKYSIYEFSNFSKDDCNLIKSNHDKRQSLLVQAMDAVTIDTDARELTANFAFEAAASYLSNPSVRGVDTASPAPREEKVADATSRSMTPQSPSNKSTRQHGEAKSEDEDINDEADSLYDEALDDEDQRWVDERCKTGKSHSEGISRNDAILSCPCCFLTICMDSERHIKYSNQYRATHAVNCRIERNEIITQALEASNIVRRGASTAKCKLISDDDFFRVNCSDCGTTVAVYDSHEVYHFFNVLPSAP